MKKGKFRTTLLTLLFLTSIGAHVFINTAPANSVKVNTLQQNENRVVEPSDSTKVKSQTILPDVEVLRKIIDRTRIDIPNIPFIRF